MSRSSWKIPHILNAKFSFYKENKGLRMEKPTIKIKNRAVVITPAYIGKTVQITNGLYFVPIRVTEAHIGFKFGSFVLTKKRARLK